MFWEKSGSRVGLLLSLLLFCGVGEAVLATGLRAAEPAKIRAKVAIIIDDVGASPTYMGEFMDLPAEMTWAILPLSRYGRQYAEEAKRLGFEIMLHQPLEPLDSNLETDPGEIKREATQDEVCRQFEINLASVPGAVGVNNHMGSAGTADEQLMNVLLWEVKSSNLFFVDSVTGPHSAAGHYAQLYRVPFARRDVFIDNESDLRSKIAALEKLMELALQHGSAIAIGHPRQGTGTAIQTMLPRFAAAGIKLVHVSELTK